MGRFGFPFKSPGVYRVEAAFHNLDGSTAVSVMQIVVEPANAEEVAVASVLFNARLGSAIKFDGTRVMEDVNDRIDWAIKKLPARHPSIATLKTTKAMPYTREQKILSAQTREVKVLPANPELVYETMKPVVERGAEVADLLGHIEYRRVVDRFTRSSIELHKVADARIAQEQLLDVFKRRKVVQPVVDAIEDEVNDLKKSTRTKRRRQTRK